MPQHIDFTSSKQHATSSQRNKWERDWQIIPHSSVLSLRACCTVSGSLYPCAFKEDLSQVNDINTLSGPKHVQELLCPMREGGLCHLGFVWVANPTSMSRVNITTHTQRHANMSHQVLCLMPLQWMSGKTRLKWREWDCAPGSWHRLNEKENIYNTVRKILYHLVSLSQKNTYIYH